MQAMKIEGPGHFIAEMLREDARSQGGPHPALWGQVECRDCGRYSNHTNEHDGRCRSCAGVEDEEAYFRARDIAVKKLFLAAVDQAERRNDPESAAFWQCRADQVKSW